MRAPSPAAADWSRPRESRPARRPLSPGNAVALLGVGHAAWGVVAYRRPLLELLRSGPLDAIGDGIFRTDEADGPRAAAFWFLLAAPLMTLTGYLAESALRRGDRQTVVVAGRAIVGIGVAGTAVIPRSGFPAAIASGLWLTSRGRRLLPDDA